MVERTKLTVLLSDESLDAVDFLAAAHSSNKTAALVRAVKAYRFLVERSMKGEKIVIHDERNGEAQELVLM